MNNMFERVRKWVSENRRLMLIVGVAVLVAGITAWAAFSGSSLEIGRFFAAAPTTCTFANKGLPECACAQNRANGTACHVCTRSFQEGNTDYSDAQWFAWDNLNLCRPSCPASFPYETERTRRNGDRFPLPEACVEKPADCPDGYFALTIPDGRTICEQSAPLPTPIPAKPLPAKLSVVCGAAQNVLIWEIPLPTGSTASAINKTTTPTSGAPSSIQIGIDLGTNPSSYTDTTVQAGNTYSYTFKNHVDVSSNTVTCSTVAPTPTATIAPTPTATTTPAGKNCSALYPPVSKCYGAHACVNHSDAVCGSTFDSNDNPGEIGYGVYYGFEDVYKAPDGTVYWFNWRSKSPPENDPTKWTWAKIPSNPQAWCTSPAQGVVSVQAPTTDLHAIFDAQAQAGRFACAVAKVGAYNNKGDSVGIDCPAVEKAYYSCRASLNDGTSTPTPAPTFSPTPPPPSPQAGPLRCNPATQTIQLGELSDHSATGGDGKSYTWQAYPGAAQVAGSSFFATYSWSGIGPKRVTVTSDGQTAICVVDVKGANTVALTKEVRNATIQQVAFREAVDVREGQTIEFAITLTVGTDQEAGPFRIVDSFPVGLSYSPGSARINSAAVPDPVIAAGKMTFSGIAVRGGTSVVIQYAAFADQLNKVPEGAQTANYGVVVTDTTTGAVTTAEVALTLFGTGVAVQPPAAGPGQIPTGPGDAVTFAFIAAIASSLLYAAYTRSAAFRGREVARLERDQGPMDFRS